MRKLNTLSPGDRFKCIGKEGSVVLVQPGRVRVKWDAETVEEGLVVPTKLQDIAPETEVE